MRLMELQQHEATGNRTGLALLGVLSLLIFLWVVARLAVVAFG